MPASEMPGPSNVIESERCPLAEITRIKLKFYAGLRLVSPVKASVKDIRLKFPLTIKLSEF